MQPTWYTAAWILPVSSPPLRDAAMLVDERGRIARIARITDIELAGDAAWIDLGAAILLPGLVNVHGHPELGAFRGLLEDLPFHEWIPALMRCKRAAAFTPDDYAAATRWICVEALRAGITTMAVTEDSLASLDALHQAGMRGLVYIEVFGPAPEQAEQSLAQLRERVRASRTRVSHRIRIGVSPHAPYTVSDRLFAQVAEYARNEELPLALHAAEAEAEELLVTAGQGPFAAGLRSRGIATPARARSTIDLLHKTGVLACRPLLIHAVRMSADDLLMIADAGAAIAHCPIANARLGHGIAPIVEALQLGLRVGLGTDSVASNNRQDILEEARVAQLQQRARLQSAGALRADELLRLATIEGARCLNMQAEIGSLEVGKAADFCVVSLRRASMVPTPDPVTALFHSARGSDVVLTAVAGQVLFRDDTVLTLAESELRERVNQLGARLYRARQEAK